MKKLLLLLALISFFGVQGQYQTSTPWMEGFDVNSKSTKIKFKDIVDAGEAYFDSIDKLAKGSGYKQFKRWEAYWQDFVGSDGMVPTSTELWEAWLDVESQSNFRNPLADESNWTSLGPVDFVNRPFSSGNIGRLNVVVQDPSNSATLYAGAPSGGIWKSTDSGANWTQLIDFALPTIGVSGIAIDKNDSNTIYIATGDDDNADSPAIGIWKSTDGGNTWAQTGLNPSNSPGDLNDIFINPNNSQELWVGTSNGVYRTTNGGTSWTTALSGIGIKAIEVKPNDATTLYAISSNRFYKSTDSGASFSQQGTGIPANSGRMVIDVTPANPDLVYLVSTSPSPNYSFQGVFKSTDSGSTFVQTLENDLVFEYFGPGSQQISQAWYDLCIAVSPTDANEVYFGVVDIYKSSDGGDNFNRINYWYTRDAAYTHADIHHLQFFGNELFVASDGGVFKTNNGGTTFSDLTNGMAISQFYRVDVSEQTSNKINGGLQDNGGYGYFNTWYNYHGGDGMEGVIDPNNDNLYYGFSQFGGTLNVSSNSGQ
ncbi:MAG: hypothetical protein KJO49_06875, partial [Bacteroidia bacterium]|nr:hypothetical protein [Bacteroidia bacterium]